MILNALHAPLMFRISSCMPSQNTDCSAQRFIPVTHWWAECNTFIAGSGVTILPLQSKTPSLTVGPDLDCQYCCSSSGSSCWLCGKVDRTRFESNCRLLARHTFDLFPCEWSHLCYGTTLVWGLGDTSSFLWMALVDPISG